LVAACGIVSAIVIELTFTPAVRILLPAPRAVEAMREGEHRFLGRVLMRLGELVIHRPRMVLGAGVGAVALVSCGIAMLEINTSFRSWFGDDEPVIVAERAIRTRFTGTSTIRVRISSVGGEDLTTPAALRGVAKLQGELAKEVDVSATISVVDYLREMHRAFDEDAPEAVFHANNGLIAQYLLLFGPEDLSRVITGDHRVAVIHALARSDDVAWVEELFVRLRKVASTEMPPDVLVDVGGGELAQAAANNAMVVREKLENLLQVGLVIFLLSAVVFRSLVAGLLVLAPLSCAVLVNLGAMGWLGTWLSFATATYASMGVSLGADFAIYLLFRLREEMRSRPLEAALRETLRTSGQAIFFVASAIAAGYATLLVSSFALWRQLGGFVALMMAVSALATLTILPALVLLVQPRFLEEKQPTRVR
jgi:predicted RND superfamily exporter protein